MIPQVASDLDALATEAERQRQEVAALFSHQDREALHWRPEEAKWSMTGHLAHLGVLNEAYLATIADRIARARSAGGPSSEGPYRHPRLSSTFVRAMEPPPRRRVRTFRSMRPPPDPDEEVVRSTFDALQSMLGEQIEAARGLDLGRIRFGSPFSMLLRLSLGNALELVLAHNRRHVWLVRELMSTDSFPGRRPAAPR